MEGGRIVNGRRSAGQFGHLVVNHAGRPCVCGQRGCLETESSGTSLRRHLDEAGYPPDTRFEDILPPARAGEERALSVMTRWAAPLQAAIGTLSAAFDPQVLLLGGGMGQAAIHALGFLPKLEGWYDCDVRAAALGDDAGIIGAGLAARAAAAEQSHNAPTVRRSKRVVLVNGVPASGKSRLSKAISRQLGWPVLALDTIKDPFLRHIEGVDRLFNRTLGKASYQAMFSVVRDAPYGSAFIVDAWFGFQPLTLLVEHLASAGVTDIAEIWCHAPGEVLAQRYSARLDDRLPGHPGAEYVPELVELAKHAAPTRLGPVFDIDTSQPFTVDDVTAWLTEVSSGD